ncbi:hypothetical protein So717_25140 [Roseobacter cerasinus]|uniref:Uncharacterized protein n=1 Tax=Roseobacter cerasinus TaxID=2602289 RepID=A0A640VUI5_9RHOB|nr:hypothetical protein [Roseobacter cerasinus]GFE50761.1 hypothetical protein So717_25140 [Roseobacter cerasinus]
MRKDAQPHTDDWEDATDQASTGDMLTNRMGRRGQRYSLLDILNQGGMFWTVRLPEQLASTNGSRRDSK